MKKLQNRWILFFLMLFVSSMAYNQEVTNYDIGISLGKSGGDGTDPIPVFNLQVRHRINKKVKLYAGFSYGKGSFISFLDGQEVFISSDRILEENTASLMPTRMITFRSYNLGFIFDINSDRRSRFSLLIGGRYIDEGFNEIWIGSKIEYFRQVLNNKSFLAGEVRMMYSYRVSDRFQIEAVGYLINPSLRFGYALGISTSF